MNESNFNKCNFKNVTLINEYESMNMNQWIKQMSNRNLKDNS